MRIVKLSMIVLALLVVSGEAFAAKTTYIATNKRFNYVKLKEVKNSIAEGRMMTQPIKIDEKWLAAALKSIKLSRHYLIKKEVDSQEVFSERAINFLTPNLARAFAQATHVEEVIFSYLQKNPIFIIRNDRLTIAKAWIHGDGLHIKFLKLFAKISGDVDKRGNERKAINNSTGLRVKLELGPGQQLGIEDSDEVVLSMKYDFIKEVELKEATAKQIEKAGKGAEKGSAAGTAVTAGAAGVTAGAVVTNSADTGARLRKLEKLKKEKLITQKEYDAKRKEILDSL
jgi:hypothetical protein